jgi:hypothetical protein
VNGAGFNLLGVTADEVAAGLDFLWKAVFVAAPAASVVYGAMTAWSTMRAN